MKDTVEYFRLTFPNPEDREFLLSFIRKTEEYADRYSSWFHDSVLEHENLGKWPREKVIAECGTTAEAARVMEKCKVVPDYLFQKRIGLTSYIHYKGAGVPLLWHEQIDFFPDHLILEGIAEEKLELEYEGKLDTALLTEGRMVDAVKLFEENGEPVITGTIMEEFCDLRKSAGIAFGRENFMIISPEGGKAQFIRGEEIIRRVHEADGKVGTDEETDYISIMREICNMSVSLLKDAFTENGEGVLYAIEMPEEDGEFYDGIENRWLMDAAMKGVALAFHILAETVKSALVMIPYGFAGSFCPACRHVFVISDDEEGRICCLNCGSRQDRQSGAAFNLEWTGRKLIDGIPFEELEKEVMDAKRRAYVNL